MTVLASLCGYAIDLPIPAIPTPALPSFSFGIPIPLPISLGFSCPLDDF